MRSQSRQGENERVDLLVGRPCLLCASIVRPLRWELRQPSKFLGLSWIGRDWAVNAESWEKFTPCRQSPHNKIPEWGSWECPVLRNFVSVEFSVLERAWGKITGFCWHLGKFGKAVMVSLRKPRTTLWLWGYKDATFNWTARNFEKYAARKLDLWLWSCGRSTSSPELVVEIARSIPYSDQR
jgi:hypothetical protein